MSAPPNTTTVTIPHSLGRDEAKRRIQSRLGELSRHIPGGVAQLESSWPADDQMALNLVAMSQRLAATLDVSDDAVTVTMQLPPLLNMMSGMIAKGVKERGSQLLLGEE